MANVKVRGFVTGSEGEAQLGTNLTDWWREEILYTSLLRLQLIHTPIQSITFQITPEGLRLCGKWAFEFLSQCSYHCGLAFTHQYVSIRVGNWGRISFALSRAHFTVTSLSLLPPSLPRWEDDTGRQMKSRCCVQVTIGRLLKMKPELCSLSAPLSCAALFWHSLAFAHPPVIKLEIIAKVCETKFKYKPESRCMSAKCSGVWADSVICVSWPNFCIESDAEPQLEGDNGNACILDPPEKQSAPLPPTPTLGYITARIMPFLTDWP